MHQGEQTLEEFSEINQRLVTADMIERLPEPGSAIRGSTQCALSRSGNSDREQIDLGCH
jgi:hypothetical protein